jgi:hypothetical protein
MTISRFDQCIIGSSNAVFLVALLIFAYLVTHDEPAIQNAAPMIIFLLGLFVLYRASVLIWSKKKYGDVKTLLKRNGYKVTAMTYPEKNFIYQVVVGLMGGVSTTLVGLFGLLTV